MGVVHLFIASIVWVLACNNPNRTTFSKVDAQSLSSSRKSELNQSIESDIITRNESGEVTEIKGLEYSETINEGENLKDSEKIRDLFGSEEKLLEFEEPVGVDADFSEPIMVSGSFLALNGKLSEGGCTWLDYSDEEPKNKDLFRTASDQNLCGSVAFSVCIRMVPEILKDSQPTIDDYIFIETPTQKIDLPCTKYSFSEMSIAIDETDLTPENKTGKVKLEVKPSVVEYYLTNEVDCSDGGTWKAIDSKEVDWELQWVDNETSVFAKFKDVFGKESACTFDTFNFRLPMDEDNTDDEIVDSDDLDSSSQENNLGPSSTSISIDGGAIMTTSTSVSLNLTSTDASEMYVTNTSGCASDGTWESYATSKTWTLAETNATATVYIKFRDVAGNESSCINDTITHDNIAPTSVSLTIGSGAYTSATANTLFPSATGAEDMYITNTAGCGSGGIWETYAITRSSWSLGQSNGSATVYAKYRDAAGNESSCVNDAIIHDSVAPSVPSDFNDGNSTHSASNSPTITWTASTDAVSGLSGYEVSIGTSSGATDIKDWTDVGNVTSTSFSDLSLTLGSSYFTNIRAVDNANNESNEVNSDSFLYGYLQQAYLKAANNDAADEYGEVLAISGDTIVIGAYLEDSNQNTITNGTTASSNNSSSDSGAVYVYKRTDGVWVQEAYIKPANSDAGDGFGEVVDIDGDTMVVSARYEDSNQTTITNGTSASSDNSSEDSGAVYVYTRSGSTWTQEAYIKAANGESGDNFGRRLAISGDTIVVGAYEDSDQTTITNGTTASTDNSSVDSGAVYVYARSGSTWTQEAYIKASNNDSEDYFGYALDIDGDTIVVGAYYEDSNQTTITNGTTSSINNSNSRSGAAYVYKRSGSSWSQEAYLKAPNSEASDRFGRYLAISGDTVAIAAYGEDSNQSTITNGTTASSNNSNSSSGAVYVFTRSGSTWTHEAYIKAANGDSDDTFGYGCGVAINGDTLVVGAESEDSNQSTITNGAGASSNNSATDSGAAYVYKRSGGSWSQVAYLKPSNNDNEDYFGYCVGVGADETIVVSSSYEDSNQTTITNGTGSSSNNSNTQSGAVFVYE